MYYISKLLLRIKVLIFVGMLNEYLNNKLNKPMRNKNCIGLLVFVSKKLKSLPVKFFNYS